MSMLAERKRKHRWSLNPRGNAWAEDSNKFGQKMLEKMGWKHGKGLGANEDGIKEHPKVSYKNDSQGMGYKEIEGWTEHEGNFSALLKNLVNTLDVDQTHLQVKPASLEETSRKSRVRVHYHKFTKGKDLSRYSEKDLASIFGKKSLTPYEDATAPNVGGESEKFIKKGCMVDYFKKKLPNFSLNTNGYVVGSNGVLQIESEGGERVGFGYEETARSLTVEYSQEISESKSSKKQRKRTSEETKSNKEGDVKLKKSERKVKDISSEMTNQEGGGEEEEEAKRNRKAKLGETDDSRSTFVSHLEKGDALECKEEDCKGRDEINKLEKKRRRKGADLQQEEVEDIKVNEGGESVKESKKNRKVKLEEATFISYLSKEDNKEERLKKEQKNEQRNSNNQEEMEENENARESKVSKKEKVSKKKIHETEAVESSQLKLKRNKKVKKNVGDGEQGISNPAFDPRFNNNIIIERHALNTIAEGEETFNDVESETPTNQSPKKKKDHRATTNESLDPSFKNCIEENSVADIQDNPYEIKTKEKNEKNKKKRKIDDGIDNRVFQREQEIKIKSKRRRLSAELALDNPSFQMDGEVEEKHEVKRKEEKLRKSKREDEALALDNPCFQEGGVESSLGNPSFEMNAEVEEKHEVKHKEKKPRKSKREDEALALDNPGFQEGGVESSLDNPSFQMKGEVEEKHEVKRKDKKLKMSKREDEALALNNPPGFQEGGAESSLGNPGFEMNAEVEEKHEVKHKEKKPRKSKREDEALALDNPGFQEGDVESSLDNLSFQMKGEVEEKHEVKRKGKKLKRSKREDEALALDNPCFQEGGVASSLDNPSFEMNAEVEEKCEEVKRKGEKLKKSKREDEALALDNPGFQEGVESENQIGEMDNSKGADGELLLNVASFPVPEADENYQRPKPRKSVRFDKAVHNNYYDRNCDDNQGFAQNDGHYYQRSHHEFYDGNQGVAQNHGHYYQRNHHEFYDGNQGVAQNNDNYYHGQNHNEYYYDNQRVAQNGNNYYRRDRDNNWRDAQNGNFYNRRNHNELFDINRTVLQNGIDNVGYDRRANNMQENIAYMSRTLDRYHAEIENDINDRKYHQQHRYVGEPGRPSEKHVKVEEGTRLSFRNVTFGKPPIWMRKNSTPGPKKSYRHLIGGDIIVKFMDSNLHEITGYATRDCKT